MDEHELADDILRSLLKPKPKLNKEKLFIQFHSRNFEVYGKTFKVEDFNESEFLKSHSEDYMYFEDDFSQYDLRIDNSSISVELNGEQICFSSDFENGKYLDVINVHCSGQKESFRDISGASDDEVVVLWFHDYEISFSYTWFDVNAFDPNNVEVHSIKRIDETEDEDSSIYEILSTVIYEGRDPDEENFDGSPKSGYIGPFVLKPT